MPRKRLAGEVFTDNGLGAQGQAILDHIQSKSGKTSNVIQIKPDDEMYGSGGGYVEFDSPQDVHVDRSGGAHVLAHELGHSQFPTELMKSYKQNIMSYDEPYSPQDKQLINTLDKANPATMRYAYEKQTVPVMLEEGNAQGVARGTTEAVGLGDRENKDIYKNPTDYPEQYGRQGVDLLNQQFSPEFEGGPLGIGITGTPAMREEYYRIQDNMPERVRRAYLKGKSLVR